MAILKNLWLNGSSQKLAGAVTYTLKGQQVIRKEAAKVANPRSTAQMNQRVRLANLVNFYRANRGWMKRGAFENKKQKQSDYNAFVSRNIRESNIALTKAEALAGVVVVDHYQVTDGSLPMTEVSMAQSTARLLIAGMTQQGGTQMSTVVPKILSAYPGIQENDQLSVIVMVNKRDSNGNPKVYVRAYELILNSEKVGSVEDNIVGPDSALTIAAGDGSLNFSVTLASGELVGYAICFSRSTSNGIKVSPAFVRLSDLTFKEGYSSPSQFEKANSSYGESSANFLDSTSVMAGDSNAQGGEGDQGGSGAGDPGDVTP